MLVPIRRCRYAGSRTGGTPRLGWECWQPGCAMLVLPPAPCHRVGWPSFHAHARPAERSFRWQHSHPFGWSRVQSSPALRSAWTRPCAREHIADRSPLQPGAMLAAAARLLVQAGGATGRSGLAAQQRRRLGCSGGAASRGDGAVARRARRSSPCVGKAVREAASAAARRRRQRCSRGAGRRRRGRRRMRVSILKPARGA